MKFKYIKSIVSAALFLSLTTGITSCINDLDISPIDPQMTATFDQDMYFTKLYASLGLTGQKLSEDPDIAVKDEGQSCFYRALFTNNEYGTDEMIWTWQENAGIPELTYMRWNSSHQQTEILYNRLAYNITLCNFFLDQIAGKYDSSVQQPLLPNPGYRNAPGLGGAHSRSPHIPCRSVVPAAAYRCCIHSGRRMLSLLKIPGRLRPGHCGGGQSLRLELGAGRCNGSPPGSAGRYGRHSGFLPRAVGTAKPNRGIGQRLISGLPHVSERQTF